MMTWPAITPTVELDSPEHSRATANTTAALRPSSGPRVWKASWIVGWKPGPRNRTTAAISTMAELISHAPFMATNTSTSSKCR